MGAGAAAGPRFTRLRDFLPTGASLPEEVWWQRHRGILVLLSLHVPIVFTVAIAQGVGVSHAIFETSAVVGLAALAWAWQQYTSNASMLTANRIFFIIVSNVYEAFDFSAPGFIQLLSRKTSAPRVFLARVNV